MINHRYKIEAKLGQGSFASVYSGTDTKTNTQVAIKLIDPGFNSLYLIESKVFSSISGRSHFPRLFWHGEHEKAFGFVMEKLGNSLADILISNNFPLTSILELGLQLLTALETLHSLSYIHRDLKPDNILTSLSDQNSFYLIDYGLCKTFMDSSTKHHAPLREDTAFKGNLIFCSKNILSGISASRRDDIESLFLLLIYLIKKELPWINEKKNLESMIGRRSSVNFNVFMKDLPSEIFEIFNYSQTLSYYQAPNYEWIRGKMLGLKNALILSLDRITNDKKIKKKAIKRAKTAGIKRRVTRIVDNDTIIIPPPDFSQKFRQKIREAKMK